MVPADPGSFRLASVKTATTIPEILGNCGPKVTQRADKVKYKRKRLSPSGLSTWVATGSKGEQYIVRVKPIRKDKRLKRVVKMPIQIACSCPYFRWQGPEHWAGQNDYLYGKPRGTASVPVIKDPLSEHWACKHVIAVLRLVRLAHRVLLPAEAKRYCTEAGGPRRRRFAAPSVGASTSP